MKWHDDEDALKRWFNNYKVGRYESFVTEYEWLVITEKPYEVRGRRYVRYEGEIGRDYNTIRRKVAFEAAAPPPPTFMIPAKKKYTPPPPILSTERSRYLSHIEQEMRRRMLEPWPYWHRYDSVPSAPPPPPRWHRN
jgi:hypothetical protein